MKVTIQFKGRAIYGKITEIYAFVAEYKGNENVMAYEQEGQYIPMIGPTLEYMAPFKPIADTAARKTGCQAKLLRFSNREEVELLPSHVVGFGG
jgi:hypothetical protein